MAGTTQKLVAGMFGQEEEHLGLDLSRFSAVGPAWPNWRSNAVTRHGTGVSRVPGGEARGWDETDLDVRGVGPAPVRSERIFTTATL